MNFNELREKAKENNAEAQYLFAMCYYNGDGVDQNYFNAVKWLEKSAAQNYAPALTYLGICYDNGDGVEANEKKAFEMYQKAADLGDADGYTYLAYCYEYGTGVEKSLDKALEICLQGAELGFPELQCNAAVLYSNEFDNAIEALKWYRKAAAQNHAHSQYMLGHYYETGKVVEKNGKLAIEWYETAAKNGNPFAQDALAEIYFYSHKKITPVDYGKAVKWFEIALESFMEIEYYYHASSVLSKMIECYKTGGFNLKRDKKMAKLLKQKLEEVKKLDKAGKES